MIKKLLKSERGSSMVGLLAWIIGFFIVLSFCFVITSIYVKYNVATTALKTSIVSAEKENLNLQYAAVIEGESYQNSVDYADNSYRETFYNSLQKCFTHVIRSDDSDSSTYSVQNQSGMNAFTLKDVKLTIAVQNKSMADGKPQRLVYTAEGTLVIPISAFGFTGGITVPATATATFQHTG